MKILLVDDDAVTRRVVALALARTHNVVQASNGRRAVEVLEDNPDVDCVICDLLMPELDGLGVLNAVAERWPELPVFVISGLVGTRAIGAAMERGARAFFAKPVNLAELNGALRGVERSLLACSSQASPSCRS